jgi:diguanylate cyclase (GGDEF)-like protein
MLGKTNADQAQGLGKGIQEMLLRRFTQPFCLAHKDGTILDCNEAFRNMFGIDRAGLPASAWCRQVAEVWDLLLAGGRARIGYEGETGPVVFDVHLYTLVPGADPIYGVFVYDLSAYKRREQELARNAATDPLTGLPNRVGLEQAMHALCGRMRRGDAVKAGVLFADIDDFKTINDRHGHAAGDAAIIEVGRRLRMALRQGDMVCRWGGDEFAGLLIAGSDEQPGDGVIDRLHEAFRRPLRFEGSVIPISVSMGGVLDIETWEELEESVGLADTAMYRAKQAGKNRCVLVRPGGRGDGSRGDVHGLREESCRRVTG